MKIIVTENEATEILKAYFKNSLQEEDNVSVEIESSVPDSAKVMGADLNIFRLKEQVANWGRDGKTKLALIKYVKNLTGWSLVECKKFVEAHATCF